MPTRDFVRASSERITCATGGLSGAPFAGRTVAAIVKRDSDQGLGRAVIHGWNYATDINGGMCLGDSNGSNRLTLVPLDGVNQVLAPTIAVTAADGWTLVAIGKASGTTTPRFHRYSFTTGVWTHEDGAATVADTSSTLTNVELGAWLGATETFDGKIGAVGVFTGNLSDALVETLALALTNWTSVAVAPQALWRLDQGTISTPVFDLTGGGANQTAITGTAAVSDEPPGFIWTVGQEARPRSWPGAGPVPADRRIWQPPDTTVPSGRCPPTLVAYQETTWSGNGAKSTPSVSWQTGDRLVVLGLASSEFGDLPVPTATGLTFAAHPGGPINETNACWADTWTATAGSDGSSTIDSTGETGSGAWGMGVWVWRGSDGFGNRATVASTAKTISLIRSQPESAVIAGLADFSAAVTTGYAFTPPPDNEREVISNANYAAYVADWLDEDAVGSRDYGITGTASTGNHSKLALEILGQTCPSGQTFFQAVDGALTSAGALILQAGKALAGATSPAGALLRQAGKALGGSTSPAGGLLKLVSKTLTGATSPSGALAVSRVILLALGGATSPSGALLKQVGKVLGGSTSPSGSLLKQVGKALAGATSPSGALATTKVVLLALAGAVSPTGALVRLVGKPLGGTLTSAGFLLKQARKALTGATSPSGAVVASRLVLLALAGATSPSGALLRRVGKALGGTSSPAGLLTKRTSKTFAGQLTAAGSGLFVLGAQVVFGAGKATVAALATGLARLVAGDTSAATSQPAARGEPTTAAHTAGDATTAPAATGESKTE